jgi:hypothetical protein
MALHSPLMLNVQWNDAEKLSFDCYYFGLSKQCCGYFCGGTVPSTVRCVAL